MPFDYHGRQPTQIPAALQSCSHVFIRVDAVRRPLSPPYEGPFLVLSRSPKTFDVERLGKRYTVTVDRLKPAAILDSCPSPVVVSPVVPVDPDPPSRSLDPAEWPLPTRSGRIPRPVDRLGVS